MDCIYTSVIKNNVDIFHIDISTHRIAIDIDNMHGSSLTRRLKSVLRKEVMMCAVSALVLKEIVAK